MNFSLKGRKREQPWRVLINLPAVVFAAVVIASIFTGWLFTIDAANSYHRGSAQIIHIGTMFFYMLMAFRDAAVVYRTSESYLQRLEAAFYIRSGIIPVVSAVCQILIPGVSACSAGIAIQMLIVFLKLQNQMITRDDLTGLYNRKSLFSNLEDVLRKSRENGEKMYLGMIDVDDFKLINDNFGHTEGDRALKLVAHALSDFGRSRGIYVARYGGDEFTVLFGADDDARANELLNEMRKKVASVETGNSFFLNISAGCTAISSSDLRVEDVVERADRLLHREKSEKKTGTGTRMSKSMQRYT